ncbi:MAG: carboxylating nicotinate-nucleotide diphosphorylase [Zavarzinella sp.]
MNSPNAHLTKLVELALQEDLSTVGDLTSQLFIAPDQVGSAQFVSRRTGIVAGWHVLAEVFRQVDPQLLFQPVLTEGSTMEPGQVIATVTGSVRSILGAERTALNFLQRLCAIATLTRTYVEKLAGLPVQILDTRKTTPGWREIEKHAVRMGGGSNHRMGLYDGILIKDNHLAAIAGSKLEKLAQLQPLIEQARQSHPGITIEVEVDTIDQFQVVLPMKPDIILLDNMPVNILKRCVQIRNEQNSSTLLEASGGITLETLHQIALTGVDRISTGALTHSVKNLDIGLDYLL